MTSEGGPPCWRNCRHRCCPSSADWRPAPALTGLADVGDVAAAAAAVDAVVVAAAAEDAAVVAAAEDAVVAVAAVDAVVDSVDAVLAAAAGFVLADADADVADVAEVVAAAALVVCWWWELGC